MHASTLLLAVAEERRGRWIETAAQEAGWSVLRWRRRPSVARAPADIADAFIFDEANARSLARTTPPPARLRLLLLDAASPTLATPGTPSVDAFLFENGGEGFAERIELAEAGYSCVPEKLFPALLADESRIARLSQLSEAELRLARLHLHMDTVRSLAATLGQPAAATRTAVRRLLRALALPAKINLASLFARARRRSRR